MDAAGGCLAKAADSVAIRFAVNYSALSAQNK
jgi:hypothetical protein